MSTTIDLKSEVERGKMSVQLAASLAAAPEQSAESEVTIKVQPQVVPRELEAADTSVQLSISLPNIAAMPEAELEQISKPTPQPSARAQRPQPTPSPPMNE